MSGDASNIVVTAHHCGTCGTDDVQVYHKHFPELRVGGISSNEAAERLSAKLEISLRAVSDPLHGDPVRQGIADLQAFLNREGAAHVGRNL